MTSSHGWITEKRWIGKTLDVFTVWEKYQVCTFCCISCNDIQRIELLHLHTSHSQKNMAPITQTYRCFQFKFDEYFCLLGGGGGGGIHKHMSLCSLSYDWYYCGDAICHSRFYFHFNSFLQHVQREQSKWTSILTVEVYVYSVFFVDSLSYPFYLTTKMISTTKLPISK